MEGKKSIEISVTKLLLVIAIIVICIMGYFLYVSNSKTTTTTSNSDELNAKIAKLENEISSKQSQIEQATSNTASNNANSKNNVTFSSLCGEYEGNLEEATPFGETQITLFLYEDGTYNYYYNPHEGMFYAGNYTFDENNLYLNKLLDTGYKDVGLKIINDTTTFKINSDNSITDTNNNVVFQKTAEKIENSQNYMIETLENAIK